MQPCLRNPFLAFCLAAAVAAGLTGCTFLSTRQEEPPRAAATAEPADLAEEREADPAEPAKAPDHYTVEEKVAFYMERLDDPDYKTTYGHGYPWYIAAEELGMIGKPAIRPLVENLDTEDEFERTLTLYALLLASQHPSVAELTDGDYAQVTNAWAVDKHPESLDIALEWWERHKNAFEENGGRTKDAD